MVLSAYKKGEYGTQKLNNLLQPLANPLSVQNKSVEYYDTTFYVGDIVMQTVNNYNAIKYIDRTNTEEIEYDEDLPIYNDEDTSDNEFIANGESGVIKDIIINKQGKTTIIIDFDGVVVEYQYDDLSMITLGYAITIHKSQGSSCKIAILLTPSSHAYFLNSNLLYVGETRAKEKVFHIGSPLTINKAIKKKADFNRTTFLKEMLINTYNLCEN
jgi:ATP-dependent exoDNAse (exonuclease V) alpha subunit